MSSYFWSQRPKSNTENSVATMQTSRQKKSKSCCHQLFLPSSMEGLHFLRTGSGLSKKLDIVDTLLIFLVLLQTLAPVLPAWSTPGFVESQMRMKPHFLTLIQCCRKHWQLNKTYWFSSPKYLRRGVATPLTTHQCGVMLLEELNAC